MAVIDKLGVLQNSPKVTTVSQNEAYAVDLQASSGLAPDVYTGVLEVRLCYGDPLKNENPIDGSPWQIPYTITVQPNIPPVGPLVTVTPDQSHPVADGDTTFTLRFDCDMDQTFPHTWDSLVVFNGGSESVIFVNPGTSPDFKWIDPRTATFTIHPPNYLQGTVFILPLDWAFRDLQGRPSHGASYADKFVNTYPPHLFITNNIATPPASGDVTFTFKFSKFVGDSFTTDDVWITGGTKGAFTWIDPQTATLVVSPTPGKGVVWADVQAGVFSDTKDRTNSMSYSNAVNYDTSLKTVPTLKLQSSISNTLTLPIASSDLLYTLTFSEPVDPNTFDLSDIKLTNATAGALIWESSTVATLVVSPMANTQDTLTLTVGEDTFKSQLGVSNTAAFSNALDFDTRSGLILNGDFSVGTSNWTTAIQNNTKISLTSVDGRLQAEITAAGDNPYDAKIISTSSLPLIEGKKYRVTFDASSNVYQTINVDINENGHDVTGVGFGIVIHDYFGCFLKPTITSFTHEFTMPITNWDAALRFSVGGKPASTIQIDNVRIVEIQ